MDDKNPLVSVIIPVYNTEEYLRECLDSVINQTLSDIEIICINDKTMDNSLSILKEYAEKDSRIILLENDVNKGVSISRNRCLDISRGKYISFLDSDDKIDLDAYEKLYNFSKKYNQDLILFNTVRFNDYGKIWPSELHVKSISDETIISTNILKNTEFVYNATAGNNFIKKSFLDKYNFRFIEGKFYEDILFSANLFCNTDNVGVFPHVKSYWRVRSNSKNKSTTQDYSNIINIKDRLFIIKSVYDLLNSSEKYKKLINPFNKKLLEIDYRHIINQLTSKDNEIMHLIINEVKPVLKEMDDDLFVDLDDLFKIKYDILMNGKIENFIKLRNYELNNQKLNVEKLALNNKNKGLIEKNLQLENDNKSLNQQKARLKNKNNNLTKKNKALKNEIKIIKSTKGWFKYKAKNIYFRLTNKY